MPVRQLAQGLGENIKNSAVKEFRSIANSGTEQIGLGSPFKGPGYEKRLETENQMLQGKNTISTEENPFKKSLTGEGLTVLNDREQIEQEQIHGQNDSERLALARRELGMQASNERTQTVGVESVLPGAVHETPEQKPVQNAFNNNQATIEITHEVMQQAVRDQFNKSQDLGVKHGDEEAEKLKKKEELEAQNKAQEDAEKKALME
jgi:hypothetical protein